MLRVEDVSKHFGRVVALEQVSAEFDQGVYGLLAPNGAGKTTLLRALATLIRPTSGEVLFDGVEISTMGADYRGMLGYLPQDFGYYRSYTGRQFLRYLATLKGLSRRTAEATIDEAIELVALSEVADRRMRTYSGGMVQRIGIAQAVLNDPKILILDEPTAGLDPKERVRFRNLISALAKDRTVILSSHIVSDIEHIATTVMMLDRGRIVLTGDPREILAPMHGRVFETTDPGRVGDGDLLLTERHDADGVRYRFLPTTPPSDLPCVPASLEDLFLATYRDQR